MDIEEQPKHFFSADWHLCHANIIKYANRPFPSVEVMNDVIIDNINDVIRPQDTLHFLGDTCFVNNRNKRWYAVDLLNRINCKNIILVRGNHDKDIDTYPELRRIFRKVCDVNTVTVDGQAIFMSHYAHRVWNKSHHGTWHLYGHSHGTLPDDPNSLSFDVGVDCHKFKPLSFDDVKRIMSKKTWKPVDHHTGKR